MSAPRAATFAVAVAAIIAFGALTLATPAEALLITSRTRTDTTTYASDGPDLVDSASETVAGPATPTTVSARVATRLDQLQNPLAPAYPGFARAAIGLSGFSEAFVAGSITSSGFAPQRLEAVVTESVTAVVPSVGIYAVTFSFDLFDIFYEAWDSGGLSGAPPEYVAGFLSYEVLLNGDRAYNMSLAIAGTRDFVRQIVICTPSPCPTEQTEATGPGDVPRRLDFDPISESDLLLGTIAGGAVPTEFTVETRMRAALELPAFVLDAGGRVGISDPNSLALDPEGSIGLALVEPTPMPLPETVWLTVSGLAALAAIGRRRTSYS